MHAQALAGRSLSFIGSHQGVYVRPPARAASRAAFSSAPHLAGAVHGHLAQLHKSSTRYGVSDRMVIGHDARATCARSHQVVQQSHAQVGSRRVGCHPFQGQACAPDAALPAPPMLPISKPHMREPGPPTVRKQRSKHSSRAPSTAPDTDTNLCITRWPMPTSAHLPPPSATPGLLPLTQLALGPDSGWAPSNSAAVLHGRSGREGEQTTYFHGRSGWGQAVPITLCFVTHWLEWLSRQRGAAAGTSSG